MTLLLFSLCAGFVFNDCSVGFFLYFLFFWFYYYDLNFFFIPYVSSFLIRFSQRVFQTILQNPLLSSFVISIDKSIALSLDIPKSIMNLTTLCEMKPLHHSMKLMFVVLVLFCICSCWLYRFCTKTLLYVLLSEFNSQYAQLSIVSLMKWSFSVYSSFFRVPFMYFLVSVIKLFIVCSLRG